MKANRPNVVIIITDDQGYGDLGCHGNPVADTPNLNRLHGESVRLTDFHAAPMCTPTRGQLLTGLDAARNGALNVSSGRTLLRPELPTIADSFASAGYATGLFGKWHLGDNYPFRPMDRGFQESLWFPSSHVSSVPDYWENDYFNDVYIHNGARERQEGYCTEVFFRRAMEWMGEQIDAESPFLCYLPTNAPHYPLYVPVADREEMEEYYARHEHLLGGLAITQPYLGRTAKELRASLIRFLAMIRNLDRQIGVLREFLRQRGADQDTILMFMTDNGSTFGSTYFNAGMRGKKTELWEGGHRVPLFLHWPAGSLADGRDVPGLTQAQDIYPTLCELCGIHLPVSQPMDGVSLASALRGNADVGDDRFLVVNYSRMPGDLDYPSPDALSRVRPEAAAVLWRRWRLIEGDSLYDLDEDPQQERNVIEEHPEIAGRMQAHLTQWWKDVAARANEPQRIVVGTDHENPMTLTACEWMDVFVDQQLQIRLAAHKNSYWHLTIGTAGRYEFELRRWPRESGLRLTEACPPAELTDGSLDEGVALPIARARVFLAGKRMVQETDADAHGATFTVDLEEGPVQLHTWFDDERGRPLCGAYYVYVERLAAPVPL